MFKILTILIVGTAAASAYDFKDTVYNQYLLEDFQSVNPSVLSRQRRHADDAAATGDKAAHCGSRHGDWKKDFTCCQSTKMDPTYLDMIKEAKKECAIKLRANNPDVENLDPFNCAQMENVKELIFCEAECVGKSMGHLDDESNIKRDVIQESFKKQFPEATEATLQQLNSYVDKCMDKLKDKDLRPEGKCNRTPIEMHHCMFAELILGCPVEEQIQNPHCDRMREAISKNDKKSWGRHALHEFLHHGKTHHRHGHQHGGE